jgi:hypothetical protein
VRQDFRQFLSDLAWRAATRNIAKSREPYENARTRAAPPVLGVFMPGMLLAGPRWPYRPQPPRSRSSFIKTPRFR